MKRRTIDSDLLELAKASKDFRPRTFRPNRRIAVLMLLLGLVLMVFLTIQLETLGLLRLLAIVLSVGLAYVLYANGVLRRISNEKFANEFANALFAGAAGTGQEFVFIVKGDNQVVYMNPGCQKYFPNGLPGDKEAFTAFMRDIGLEHIDWRAVQHRGSEDQTSQIQYPLALQDRNGVHHRLSVTVEPIRRPEGYAVVKAADAEAAMRSHHEVSDFDTSLIRMFGHVPWGVYVTKREGSFQYVNPALAEMLGYAPHEMQEGITMMDVIFGTSALTQDDFDHQWEQHVALKQKNGQPLRVFVKQILIPSAKEDDQELLHCGFVTPDFPEILPKEGEFRPAVQDIEGVVSDNEGAMKTSLPEMPLVVGDFAVTDSPVMTISSAEAFSSFEDSLSKVWHHFLERSLLAVALLDREGNITESNLQFRRLAVGEDASHPKTLEEAIDQESREQVRNVLDSLKEKKEGENVAIEVSLLASGQGSSASLYINPITKREKVIGFVCFLIDMTEQKNLELRYTHSQRMQAVGQLAGGVAHDFNNLLTAMLGFCDLLLMRHSPTDATFGDVMQIKQNANRAANLVRQLLAFSRKQTLQPEIIDVNETLSEVSALVRRLIGERIDLKLRYGRDAWPVRVDEGQLEQVIINLAVNARDAMQEEGGELLIRVENRVVDGTHPLLPSMVSSSEDDPIASGDYLCIEVEDNGEGISSDILKNIFEPFFTTKQAGEGTGLGLSTVYGIIKQTGGYLYVRSEKGKGTCFSIFLPRVEQALYQEQERKKEEMETIADMSGTGTILLVEDESAVRMFSARALQTRGYKVLEAENAEEALKLVDGHGGEISLIISDVVMPGMSGPDMVKKVRESYPDLQVVFISGYGEDAFMKSFGDDRAFHFLPKPYSLDKLTGKVKEVMLEGKHSQKIDNSKALAEGI